MTLGCDGSRISNYFYFSSIYVFKWCPSAHIYSSACVCLVLIQCVCQHLCMSTDWGWCLTPLSAFQHTVQPHMLSPVPHMFIFCIIFPTQMQRRHHSIHDKDIQPLCSLLPSTDRRSFHAWSSVTAAHPLIGKSCTMSNYCSLGKHRWFLLQNSSLCWVLKMCDVHSDPVCICVFAHPSSAHLHLCVLYIRFQILCLLLKTTDLLITFCLQVQRGFARCAHYFIWLSHNVFPCTLSERCLTEFQLGLEIWLEEWKKGWDFTSVILSCCWFTCRWCFAWSSNSAWMFDLTLFREWYVE